MNGLAEVITALGDTVVPIALVLGFAFVFVGNAVIYLCCWHSPARDDIECDDEDESECDDEDESEWCDAVKQLHNPNCLQQEVLNAAGELLQKLREVGEATDWKDGDETDRVYSWQEFERLRKALLQYDLRPGTVSYAERVSPL